MKKLHKIVSLLLVAAILLTGSIVALASGITAGEITLTGLNDLAVRQAARNYMDTRIDFLLGESDGMNWLVNGINNDEAAHKAKLEERAVELRDMSYVIDSVECGDTEAVVVVNETIDYVMGGVVRTETVEHALYVMLYEGTTPFVAADGYWESFSGFESCSYVEPNSEYATNFYENNGGSKSCIINVAISQLGQGEDEKGETVYGKMFNAPSTEWCAAFICWCAENANIATTTDDDTAVIYRSADCDELRELHARKGTYYESRAFGGSETPEPGDIMFIGYEMKDGTLDAIHVALVERVDGNTIHYINPNSSDGTVKRLTRSITGSDILGYGRPAYENSGHVATTYTCSNGMHSGTCMNCGIEFEGSHELVYREVDGSCHQEMCAVCQYVASTSSHIMGTVLMSDSTYHWYECGGCGYKENVETHSCGAYQYDSTGHWKCCSECGEICNRAAHILMNDLDGTKYCKTCGYRTIGAIIMKQEESVA